MGDMGQGESKKKQGFLSYLVPILVLVAGVCVLLYPTVSDYLNAFKQSRVIMGYASSVASISPEEYDRLFHLAEEYNESLLSIKNIYKLDDQRRESYEEALNINGTGMMAYVEVPSIKVSLPVYHGTQEKILQTSIGHIEWSSLPVGGPSTHSVLSGHRGLPSAKLFTDLDKVVKGDIFKIYVLDEVLTYEVDQILTVLPEDSTPLQIFRGMDYCTLVTCTPYGINTHRLLVRGHRIGNIEEEKAIRVTSDGTQVDRLFAAPFAAVPLVLVLIFMTIDVGPRLMDPEFAEGDDSDDGAGGRGSSRV